MPAAGRTEGVVRQGRIGAAGGIALGVHDSVKILLGRSFPNPGDDAKITAMFAASVKDDSLGIPATLKAGELWIPIRPRSFQPCASRLIASCVGHFVGAGWDGLRTAAPRMRFSPGMDSLDSVAGSHCFCAVHAAVHESGFGT